MRFIRWVKSDDSEKGSWMVVETLPAVSINKADNGKITANPVEAEENEQITITAKPDANYVLCGLDVYKDELTIKLTALSGSTTGGEGFDKLTDDHKNTKWGSGTQGWIILKANQKFLLTGYTLTTANDTESFSGRNWKTYQIYGANFDSDSEATRYSDEWQLVTSVENDTTLEATNFTPYDYSVKDVTEEYQYYKVEVLNNAEGSGMSQMSELSMRGVSKNSKVDLTPDGNDPTKFTVNMPTTDVIVRADFRTPGTVTWVNWDGTLLEKDENLPAGTTPEYNGKTPTKDLGDGKVYEFVGWNPSVDLVNGDVTYTAVLPIMVAQIGSKKYASIETAIEAWKDGTTLTLLDDVTISSRINISGTRTLDLNDHGITMKGTDTVFYIGSGADLTLTDSATEKSTHYYSAATSNGPGSVSDTKDEDHPYSFTGGYITGGKGYYTSSWRKGGVAYIDGGVFTINGVTLVGNQAQAGSGVNGVEGGTIYAQSGSFTLNGGNILANYSSNGAGGVFVEGGAIFRMNSGSIRHCFGTYGSAVRRGSLNKSTDAIFLTGGTISDNTSPNSVIDGSEGSLKIENVTITNNKGGVKNAVLYISGSPVIKDNTVSDTNSDPMNVVVPSGAKINITGALTNDAIIGVSMVSVYGEFTDCSDPSYYSMANFVADKEINSIIKNNNDQLELVLGTEHCVIDENTITLKDATGWEIFCDMLMGNANGYFTGKTVVMGDSFTITRMAGDGSHKFTGTFDGKGNTLTVNLTKTDGSQCCAPFSHVENATIKNLKVEGTITTNGKFAAGISAYTLGTTNITNCISSVTINSSVNGDGTHGGFVGVNDNGTTLTMTGCVFNGSMLGENTTNNGGFVGWTNTEITFNDCLFAPGTFTVGASQSGTFHRNNKTSTYNNTYYTREYNDGEHFVGQGKKAYTAALGDNVIIDQTGTVYDASGITAYEKGLLFDGKFYASAGEQAAVSYHTPEGYDIKEITVTGGTFENNILTMPEEDVTVNAVFEIQTFTVIWKNGNDEIETDENVEYGSTPEYNGETPTKATDDGYIYTFAGWTDDTNTYGLNDVLPDVTSDVTYTAVFDSADKYVAEVVEMINALPEAKDVTADDSDAVEAAREAYDALTNEQKALIDADILAKLEAAEEALIPELVNGCCIENDTDAIYLGDEITVSGSAEGGKGEYTYAFYYKKTSSTNWLAMAPAYTTASASFKPAAMVNYDVKTVVKDERGVTAERILTFKVKKPLTNDSTVNAEEIAIGEKIVVTGAASGGAKDYTYAFYYKKSSKTDWYKMADPYTTKRASVTPSAAVSYDVKVIVKDAAGNTEERIFTVKVNKPLTNDSTINAVEIALGEKIVVTGAASGGARGYTYAFYYKKSSKDSWYAMAEPYTTRRASFKPAAAVSYDVKVVVKDADGNTEELIFTVNVTK